MVDFVHNFKVFSTDQECQKMCNVLKQILEFLYAFSFKDIVNFVFKSELGTSFANLIQKC